VRAGARGRGPRSSRRSPERCAALGVEIRGRQRFVRTRAGRGVERAGSATSGREFLDLILAARVVGSIDEAIAHIARHASDHTEAILTEDDRTPSGSVAR
jgi:glutamate-5-semialdehyde dehydrogenase